MNAAISSKHWAVAAALLVALLGMVVAGAGAAVGDQPPIVWRWDATGPLPQEHTDHTATLLADGRVLVVGDADMSRTTAAIYDPAGGTWSETGPLVTPRYGHTATLLADGRVLVAGGWLNEHQVHRTAELFDPTTGLWTAAADMLWTRADHAAVLLPDGDVLVMGGELSLAGIPFVERYDPATDTWTVAGEMNKGRALHTATLLDDGRVLVVGGYLPGNVAEVYDPATDAWRYTGGRSIDFPDYHAAVRLDDGRVYVVDREVAGLYDPAAEAWTSLDSPAVGDRFAMTLLADGRVLVAGGDESPDFPPVTFYFDTTVLVDVTGGQWEYANAMLWGRAGHTVTRLADGSVLAAGGLNNPSTAEVFRPHTLTEMVVVPVVMGGFDVGE